MVRELGLKRCETVWSLSTVYLNKKFTFTSVREDRGQKANCYQLRSRRTLRSYALYYNQIYWELSNFFFLITMWKITTINKTYLYKLCTVSNNWSIDIIYFVN